MQQIKVSLTQETFIVCSQWCKNDIEDIEIHSKFQFKHHVKLYKIFVQLIFVDKQADRKQC